MRLFVLFAEIDDEDDENGEDDDAATPETGIFLLASPDLLRVLEATCSPMGSEDDEAAFEVSTGGAD